MTDENNNDLTSLGLIRISLEAYERLQQLAESNGYGPRGVARMLVYCSRLNIAFIDARPETYQELRVWSKGGLKVYRRFGRLPIEYLLGVKKQFEITNLYTQNIRLNGTRKKFIPEKGITSQLTPVLEAIGLEFLKPYPGFPRPVERDRARQSNKRGVEYRLVGI